MLQPILYLPASHGDRTPRHPRQVATEMSHIRLPIDAKELEQSRTLHWQGDEESWCPAKDTTSRWSRLHLQRVNRVRRLTTSSYRRSMIDGWPHICGLGLVDSLQKKLDADEAEPSNQLAGHASPAPRHPMPQPLPAELFPAISARRSVWSDEPRSRRGCSAPNLPPSHNR
jgi:hypothetical protein